MQICKYYVRVVCIKSKREQMLWHIREFGNNLMKMCFDIEQKWKLIVEIQKLKPCLYQVDCNIWWNIFCHEFFMFGLTHIFFSLIVICNHFKSFTPNDVPLILMCEMKHLKKLMNHKRKECIILLNVFLCIFIFS